MTAITRFDGRHEGLAYLDYTTDAIAYHLVERPSVLVLGAGSGSSDRESRAGNVSEIPTLGLLGFAVVDASDASLVVSDSASSGM